MRKITQRELRNDSAKVIRAVQDGESMTVTRNGTPVAELRPLATRYFVARTVIVESARNAPRIDAQRFRADVDALVSSTVNG